LFKNLTIKTALATLIFIVYAYSITPKIYLHNLVANHVDNCKVLKANATEFSAIGFSCKCDNLVAESPFIPEEATFPQIHWVYFDHQSKTFFGFSSIDKVFSQLRGPPVC
jgi:hypothetical protein